MILKIISQRKVELETEVQSVTIPGEQGPFMVLRDHAATISNLTSGKVSYKPTDGSLQDFEIKGGVADIRDNIITLCII